MTDTGLASGLQALVDGAKSYFGQLFQNPQFHISEAVDSGLNWIPSLYFRVNDHLTVICEASENPYPLIFSMRRLDVLKLQIPVSIYCICTEEAYLGHQGDAKRLMNDGYGLLTLDAQGNVQRRASCIPLLQQITDEEFQSDIRTLPKKLRSRIAEAFDRYKHNAPSGSADMAEIMEGLVLKAGRDAARKKWISPSDAKPGAPAATLKAMSDSAKFNNATAAIGAAQAYISMYRNINHHFPKNKKQAATKYRDCRHSFLEGVKKIVFFRDVMRALGLTGGI